MVLAERQSRFPSQIVNFPIALNQHIEHKDFSNNRLNIRNGALEGDPKYNTLYNLTLKRLPDHPHQALRIAQHFWGTRDVLFVKTDCC